MGREGLFLSTVTFQEPQTAEVMRRWPLKHVRPRVSGEGKVRDVWQLIV